ncbi:hypothetical protein HO173_003199 [Letharia columbiana]|uniref:Uncharacterized protein n=1 Tax=Letharia columbiana TaxID=112416 RepID=A0A8H6L7T5_9LECA|nr:uncharacterized protein HO173_003199 [Letharia columbiana]KAF6238693.1 hypothetical protein HO173_003199 [Letharia columbiana]
MDETEWTRGEEAFGAIASAANIYLAEVQRVGFDGSDAYEEWEGWDLVLKDCVQLHYQEVSERNELKPAWTDQAGGFSPLFKAMVLKSMMPFLKSELIAAFGGEDEGFKLDVQPCAVTFAGVIS